MFFRPEQKDENLLHEFHLSPRGKDGVFCDEGGAFVGAVPMLARTPRNGKDEWRPRDCNDLSQEMSAQYGLPVDMSSKRGGLTAIAKALNEGDVVRAQIATVLLGVPDPPSLSKGAPSRQELIRLASDLHWSGLLKADWDPDEHPRWPAGSADGKGGEFAPKGEGSETGASPISYVDTTSRAGSDDPRPDRARPDVRIQLADAGVSDASDDPTAQAAARAAEAQRNASAQTRPANSEHEGFWQKLGSELSEETKALLVQIGRAQIEQSDAELATATATGDAIAHTVQAFAEYRAQPWLGADGRPVQVPVINPEDLTPEAALMGPMRFEPNEPVMRPATNADWIDPLVDLASLAAMAAGPALRLAGSAAEAIDAVEAPAIAAEGAFETTEGVAVSGGRAIDRAASYETGVRNLYGDLPISQRRFEVVDLDGTEVSGIADSIISIDGELIAVDAKYVDDWATSLRNPGSEVGGEPWARNEQMTMIQQAKAYVLNFPSGVVYHTNSVDLAAYYTNVFRKSGLRNFRFVITPATKMSKAMPKSYMEYILGVEFEHERKVPGTRPGEEASVRYVSFDDPASIPKLFHEVLNKIKPYLRKSGGATLEGTRLELPDGGHFFAILFTVDLEGWREQIELGAKALGRATAKVQGGDIIVSDGRSYPLSSCKIEFD